MGAKNRYSDEELQEFKELILEKLRIAQSEYEMYNLSISETGNGTQDTDSTFKGIQEESSYSLSKEESGKLAQRQLKFIQHLQAALVRVENKTYGICRETGKLISKERLRAVPHATLSMDAKMCQT